MAHAVCPNGHNMWNGDGKVCINAFRVRYVEQFCKEHPSKFIDYEAAGSEHFAIWDLFELGDPKEEYDIWRCTECKALSIWNHDSSYYYGYKLSKNESSNSDGFKKWENISF